MSWASRSVWPAAAGLAVVLTALAPTDAAAQSCGDLGGTYCSQSGSCPNGYESLGWSEDCSPCCREEAPLPSCGAMGGDYCSHSGSCPNGYESLGSSNDCSPCCRQEPQLPSCGAMGGDYCSHSGSCPNGYESLGSSNDCSPCCRQQPQLPTCGAMGGDYCSHSGSCPAGYESLGNSNDCSPCCRQQPQLPTCGEMGGDYCSHSGSCPQGYQNLGTSRDCNSCCQAGPTCGALGGSYCSQSGACPQGYQNLGPSPDCNPCCRPGPSCGELGGTLCSQSGSCPQGYQSLGISTDCSPCCGPVPPPPGTDDAQVLSAALPSSLACGATYQASVTMKNTGSTTWTGAAGYKLGALGDTDPFFPLSRVYLPEGVSVPPGASHTFAITLTAPPAGGSWTTDWQMVHEGVQWFGGAATQAVRVTCVEPGDHAERASDTLPRSMLCDGTVQASVTMRNAGTTDWTAAAGYELAAVSGSDPFVIAARVALPDGLTVRSTEEHTFTLTFAAPAIPGVYPSRWQMRRGSTWFGAVVGGDVTVACPQGGDAAQVTRIDIPSAMLCGQAYPSSVTMMNVGSSTWRRRTGGPREREHYRLGAVGDSDPLFPGTRVNIAGTTVVEPGSSHTFSMTLTAPATEGTYITDWQMVFEDDSSATWFGQQVVQSVQVACQDLDDAVKQGANLPRSLADGQRFEASVTMRNTGTSTWTAAQGYRLGAKDDSDPFTSATRVELPRDVPPGDSVTFTFTLEGTGQPGITDWRMVHDGVGWFGETATQDVTASGGAGDLVAICPSVLPEKKADRSGQDPAAGAIQDCINAASPGDSLRLPAGTYLIETTLSITKRLTFGAAAPPSPGNWATSNCDGRSDCVTLLAAPALGSGPSPDDPGEILHVNATDVTLDHLVLNGNRSARLGRRAAVRCAAGEKNAANAALVNCTSCQFTYSVSKNALCASGMKWVGRNAVVHHSVYRDNGDFNATEMWADGLTLLNSDGAQVTDNTFADNSDIGLILGGARDAEVLRNTITQSAQPAFGGLMLDNFGNNTPGDFTGTVVGGSEANKNRIHCNGKCQLGIQLGPHPWYVFEFDSAGRPFCSRPVRNIRGGTVTFNEVTGAWQGINIDGAGDPDSWIEVHDNTVTESGGASRVFFNCGRSRPTSNYNYFLVQQQHPQSRGDSWVDTKGTPLPAGLTFNGFHPCGGVHCDCNQPPVARPGSGYQGIAGQAVSFDGRASSDPDGVIASYAWNFGDSQTGSGASPVHTYTSATGSPFTVHLTVTDDCQATGTATTLAVIGANAAPTVSLTSTGTCGAGCAVTFTSAASDPEGGPLTHTWSGCASGTATAATCSRPSAGSLAATVTVQDTIGQPASASASVPVYASAYSAGAWSACAGSGAFTCTSAAANGCSRPGAQARSVTESAWTLDAGAAAAKPSSSQSCTETAQGYVAGYYVGPWGGCSASCGGGEQYRTVSPNAWKATAPSVGRPNDSQGCNNGPCRLTCYDYPDTFRTKGECFGAGWKVCEVRYRDDGVGGLLFCWKGF